MSDDQFEFILGANGDYDAGARAVMRIPGYPLGVSYDRPFAYPYPFEQWVSQTILQKPERCRNKRTLLCMKFGVEGYLVPIREVAVREVRLLYREVVNVYFTIGKLVDFRQMGSLLDLSQQLKENTPKDDLDRFFYPINLKETTIPLINEDDYEGTEESWCHFTRILYENIHIPTSQFQDRNPILLQVGGVQRQKSDNIISAILLSSNKPEDYDRTGLDRICRPTYGYELYEREKYLVKINYAIPLPDQNSLPLTSEELKEVKFCLDWGESIYSEPLKTIVVTRASNGKGEIKLSLKRPQKKHEIVDGLFELRLRSYPERHKAEYSILDLEGKQQKIPAYVPSTSIFIKIFERWRLGKFIIVLIILLTEICLGVALWVPGKAAIIFQTLSPVAFQVLGSLSMIFIWPTLQYLYRLRPLFR